MEMITGYKLAFAIGLTFLGIVGVIILLDHIVSQQNADKFTAIGTIFAAIGGVGALFFVGYQAMQVRNSINLQREQGVYLKESVDAQKDQVKHLQDSVDAQKREIQLNSEESELQHRPYLYLQLPKPMVSLNESEGAWFGGGELVFRNVGKDPATIIESKYMVASDRMGDIKFVEWFESAFGGFPDVKVVMPGQEDAQVPCHPMISPADKKPRMFYVGAVITYKGPKPGKIYWYRFSQLFVLKFQKVEADGKTQLAAMIHPHKPDHDWDQNIEGSKVPKLIQPDWEKYLSLSYIKTLNKE